jgi:hypothetical protein
LKGHPPRCPPELRRPALSPCQASAPLSPSRLPAVAGGVAFQLEPGPVNAQNRPTEIDRVQNDRVQRESVSASTETLLQHLRRVSNACRTCAIADFATVCGGHTDLSDHTTSPRKRDVSSALLSTSAESFAACTTSCNGHFPLGAIMRGHRGKFKPGKAAHANIGLRHSAAAIVGRGARS